MAISLAFAVASEIETSEVGGVAETNDEVVGG